jgi:hypothetical protein
MNIDPETELKILIKKGSVFYFSEESFTKSYPYYFVVLNNNPIDDGDIFMVAAKSFNLKDIYRFENGNFSRETFVDISEKESKCFNRITLFDCNLVIIKDINILIEKMKSGKLKNKGYIEDEVLKRICSGVISSPIVENGIKKKIC